MVNGISTIFSNITELKNDKIFRSRFYYTIFMVHYSTTSDILCQYGSICASYCSKYLGLKNERITKIPAGHVGTAA